MSRRFLLWFRCNEGDDNFHHLLQWLYYKRIASCAFFGGFAAKKVMAAMSLPSSMVMAIAGLFFFFLVLMI